MIRAHPRRPRTRSLRRIYDEGTESAQKGSDCPYEPPQEHGDDIRAYFWRNGYDDEQTERSIAAIV